MNAKAGVISARRSTLLRLWLFGLAPAATLALAAPAAASGGSHSLPHSKAASAGSARTAAISAPTPAVPAPFVPPLITGNGGYPGVPADHVTLNCASNAALCTEVNGWQGTFPYYVGHDEPSLLFYSNQHGSGNQMTYTITLPTDPGNPTNYTTASTTNSYNFQLHPAFWFGMAMCDTQSYPQQFTVTGGGSMTDPSLCPADSDTNNSTNDFAGLSQHKGTAFMEMQFYPPGWNNQPVFTSPCFNAQQANPNNTMNNKWCAALNIDSLSEDPINGTSINSNCTTLLIGSPEYVNYGIVTTNGASQGPANPVLSTPSTYGYGTDPNTFFMNPGDQLQVTFNDIPDSTPGPNGSGLQVVINDLTTHTSGSMVTSGTNGASPAPTNLYNGFAMVQKNPGQGCTPVPYNFHPMYDTSSSAGRVIWAAHTYNVSFSDEIGHFDFCNPAPTVPVAANCDPTGALGFTESQGEASDADDTACDPPPAVGVKVSGCFATNGGFDGLSYQRDWPAAGRQIPSSFPRPVTFTSPLTGGPDAAHDNIQYSNAAFETDLPRVEGSDLTGTKNSCQRLYQDANGVIQPLAGNGCYLLPLTDDSTTLAPVSADFYPWFTSVTTAPGVCFWEEGGIAGNGAALNDFGSNNAADPHSGNPQYGSLQKVTYLAGNGTTPSNGKTIINLENFHNDIGSVPCTSSNPALPEVLAPWVLALVAVPVAAFATTRVRRRWMRPA